MKKRVITYRRILLPLLFISVLHTCISAQLRDTSVQSVYKPLVIKLNEEGSHYLRFILWHQIWTTTNALDSDVKLQVTPSIRRSRVLAYAQISSRFLILTHFGLNNFNPDNLTSLGNDGNAPQLFLHDAWGEIQITKALFIGAGLHYWKGLTRMANASTLNLMSLDQTRPWVHWHSFGITDQFARHLGVYAKGEIGKLDYRLAVNVPGRNPLDDGRDYSLSNSGLSYTGVNNPDADGDPTGNTIVEGYFNYDFWDQESNKLPYTVGSYLGEKKVLALGTGFFLHPNGMFNTSTGQHVNVTHFAADIFMEYPLGNGDMVHAYTAYINMDYGENYVGRWGGTGSNISLQLGYYVKSLRLMPYFSYQHANYEGLETSIRTQDIGVNYFISGHNCKVTLEYHNIVGDLREASIATQNDELNQLRLQLHIFL